MPQTFGHRSSGWSADAAVGSFVSFEASSSNFRCYPERRHSLALQNLTKGAITGREQTQQIARLFDHLVGAGDYG